MDLPFQQTPETATTRRVVLAEIQRVQALFQAALQVGATSTFDWWGAAHWVDRQRWLALKAKDVEAFPDATTLPESEQTEDLLSYYGGESRSLDIIEVIDVLSWLVSDTLATHSWWPAVTQTLNLVMVQPLVNPASAPLFWVAAGWVLASADAASDLMVLMRPMTFDMSRYPASRDDAPAVRAAQAAFLRTVSPALLPASWASLDDLAWAEVCKQAVLDWRYCIESELFALVTRRAELMRAGLWRG